MTTEVFLMNTDFTKLSTAGIKHRFDKIAAMRTHLKAEEQALREELSRRFDRQAEDAFHHAGKEHGQISFPSDTDGLAVEAKIEQSVSWDSDKLMAVAATMPWEDVSRIFKIKMTMPEASYNALLNGELRTAVTAARTTKIKPVAITLKEKATN